MRQGELKLTEPEMVAEVRHRGLDYQLRRTEAGAWEFWRFCLNGWRTVYWLPSPELREGINLVELIETFGGRPAVPVAAMKALADQVNQ